MKILVTGGAGYIGSHTVVELFDAGYEPVIVDNFCNSYESVISNLSEILGSKIVCHKGDCCDRAFMQKVIEDEKNIEGIIHFAALKAVGESVEKPELYHSNNIGSMKVILEMMNTYGINFLVFSSSACVYGQPDVLPVTEKTELKKPTSPYGETKKICEDLISEAVHSGEHIKAISLRYFNPIGAHKSAKIGELPIGVPNNLVPFVTQTAAGKLKELVIFGDDYNTEDGTAVRDYIHVVDLAKAHVKALKYLEKIQNSKMKIEGIDDVSPLGFYDIFNLGTGKGNSVKELLSVFEKVTGVKVNYRIGDRRAGDVEVLYANCEKAREILGWETKLTLADALKDAWEWQIK